MSLETLIFVVKRYLADSLVDTSDMSWREKDSWREKRAKGRAEILAEARDLVREEDEKVVESLSDK